MRHYCLGFVFDPDQNRVLLLQKRSTDRFNPGAWNGLGGQVETGETALQAMVRECREEAGMQVDGSFWHRLGELSDGETYQVEVFAATALLDAASQQTDEVIRIFDRASAGHLEYAASVDEILRPWLEGAILLS